jgi:AcrR family transcriptional regulator
MGAPRSADDFSALFEAAFARLQVALLEACRREDDWPEKIAAAVRAGLEFAAADPDAALVLTSEALAHGREGVARHERLLGYLGERLLPGRDEGPDGDRLPDITERAIAGGVLALVSQRVDRGRPEELSGLAAEAIQFVLTPYIGTEESRRLATRTL